MGYSHFLGVYMHSKPVVITTTTTNQGCPNKKCENHKKYINTTFCSKCGTAAKEMTFTIKEETDMSGLLYDDNTGDEVPFYKTLGTFRDYIISNKLDNSMDAVYDEDQNHTDAIFVDGQKKQFVFDAQAEINKFKKIHAKQIAKFIALGFKPIIRFGPLSEWD